MASKKAPTKQDCDPHLFWPEPPSSPRHIKRLFCGRQTALDVGLAKLKRGLDLRGRRSKKFDKQPWVIHGESRSGKSHLARRIQVGLPRGKKRIHVLVSAQERTDALVVMQEIFEILRGEFTAKVHDQTLTANPLAEPAVQIVNDLVRQTALFFGGGAEKATITVEESMRDAMETSVGFDFPAKLFRFLAKFQTDRTERHAVQVVLRNPTPRDLAELCGFMAETLVRFKLADHVMILVDDVDPLEGYTDPGRNGDIQRSVLAGALGALHATSGVDVLITARSWYARAKKELLILVDLADYAMEVAELLDIHEHRQNVLGAKDGGSRFLAGQALEQVAQDARGLPGVFLQHLDTA